MEAILKFAKFKCTPRIGAILSGALKTVLERRVAQTSATTIAYTRSAKVKFASTTKKSRITTNRT